MPKKEVKLVKRLKYYSLGLCIFFRIGSLQYPVHACRGQLEQLLKQLPKLKKRPNCFNTSQLFWRIRITLLESIKSALGDIIMKNKLLRSIIAKTIKAFKGFLKVSNIGSVWSNNIDIFLKRGKQIYNLLTDLN